MSFKCNNFGSWTKEDTEDVTLGFGLRAKIDNFMTFDRRF